MDNVTRLKLSNTVAMKVIKNDEYPVNGTTTITITMTNSQPTDVAISNSATRTTKSTSKTTKEE